ncbi:MAG: hypothetical protein JO316_01285 [Abitibacteriaceae bacterium]|nr:hypothetical protein [Abditibacteriaceae bacterium]
MPLPPAHAEVVPVGLGSYTNSLPVGAKDPASPGDKTDGVAPPLPTSDWWSSLLWTPFSEPQFPHPLAVRALAAGLQIYYPGDHIAVSKTGIVAGLAGGGQDFVLGHSHQAQFPKARLKHFSDWFVTTAFAAGGNRLDVTYGHGSPFVYALYAGGEARLTFATAPTVWSGNEQAAVLGISSVGHHYGLFGPTGASWEGLGTTTLTCHMAGKNYFSVALLPDNTPQTLAIFQRYAYAHVVDTRVGWKFDAAQSVVTTAYYFTTKAYEGQETNTLFALYPHQWRYRVPRPNVLPNAGYDSVRGRMRLQQGNQFTTMQSFPGVLPALPDAIASNAVAPNTVSKGAGSYDQAVLRQYVEEAANAKASPYKDTYWEGKYLGQLASLVPIAEQCGDTAAANRLLDELKARLQYWFTAETANGGGAKRNLFYYNRTWGTLIGYPASYGSDTELNDHHFHYGYFLQAAAEVARHDPTWADDAHWGGMVKLLVRDIASFDRNDPMFPLLRYFDPYAGHSWASGTAKFGDGNNQESSSEAMNAWTGLILWGAATGDTKLRDLGIYLYTTEMNAINEYWFDVHGENHPKDYAATEVAMIWGGKSVNETWFSGAPVPIHAINWMPFHGGSLYLGDYPNYVRRNYAALKAENGGEAWHQWADLVWMYEALADPADALRQFNAHLPNLPIEAGNSKANLYHWLYNLDALGQVDATVRADYPVYAVSQKAGRRHYVVYNMDAAPRTVTFSDGTKLAAKPHDWTLKIEGGKP